MVTSHEVAKDLLSLPDKELTISIDISTGDNDAGNRVFTDEYFGINDIKSDDIVLLFSGVLDET